MTSENLNSPSNSEIKIETEIRHFPSSVLSHLARILDYNDSWKDLASVIPNPDSEDILLLSAQDIRILEEDKLKRSCSPTKSLLLYWGTFGKKRANVQCFLDLLLRCGLKQAAHYVAVEVLHQASPFVDTVVFPKEEGAPVVFTDPYLSVNGDIGSAVSCVQHYTYATLENATQRFCSRAVDIGGCLLGEGAFGTVFLGRLGDGQFIAVKRLKDCISKQFTTELQVLSRFEHDNLLPLLGYSRDGPATCLIYEYLAKGSLQHCLTDKDNPIVWSTRLSIALGAARGINHLHVHENKPLVHRDVKSANILLDSNYVPKLGDFGLAHLGSSGASATVVETTTVSGTSPYMAPEAFRGDVSAKMDVFSYGIVLLELLTGLPPYDQNREDKDLLTHIQANCDDICKFLDPRAGLWSTDIADSVYHLSVRCNVDGKRDRPTMAEVVQFFEQLNISVK